MRFVLVCVCISVCVVCVFLHTSHVCCTLHAETRVNYFLFRGHNCTHITRTLTHTHKLTFSHSLNILTQAMRDLGRQSSPDIKQIDLDVLRTFRNHIMYRERYGIK